MTDNTNNPTDKVKRPCVVCGESQSGKKVLGLNAQWGRRVICNKCSANDYTFQSGKVVRGHWEFRGYRPVLVLRDDQAA